MTLLKLKNGQLINLDLVSRVTPRVDIVEVELAGLSMTITDKDDVAMFWAMAAFWAITGPMTPVRS